MRNSRDKQQNSWQGKFHVMPSSTDGQKIRSKQ
jgi:hypothetical protein